MAVLTKHPVSAPPAPPPREKTAHLLLRGWCVFVLLLAIGGTTGIDAVGPEPVLVAVIASAVVSAVLWAIVRPPFAYRRLPWFVLVWLAWTLVSIAWSTERIPHALDAGILTIVAGQGLFLAAVLAWRDIVRALASAVKWALGLRVLIEVWTVLFDPAHGVRITHDRHALAVVALLAIVVFAVRFAARAPRRSWLLAWSAIAAFFFVRAASPAALVCAAAVLVVLGTVLLMRTARRPGERTRFYAVYAGIAVVGGALVWLGADTWFGPLDSRSLWSDVLERYGVVGVALIALTFLAFVWRAWFFAIDRPRFDLRADRPYSPLTLLPTLVGALLLALSLFSSTPVLTWGWLLLVLFAAKIKQAPLVGVGTAEQSGPDTPAARSGSQGLAHPRG